jgi:para-nitrobenzyl esterase
LLLASPLAQGLFSSAAMESGNCDLDPLAVVEASDLANVVSPVGCAASSVGEENVATCLRGVPADVFVSKAPGSFAAGSTFDHRASIDGFVIPDQPDVLFRSGHFNQVPLIIGSTSFEYGSRVMNPTPVVNDADYRGRVQRMFGAWAPSILAQYPASHFPTANAAFVDLMGDYKFTCPARRYARSISRWQPVYRYFFTHSVGATIAGVGAFHALDLFTLLDTYSALLVAPSTADSMLTSLMQSSWGSFAKTGDPSGRSATWPTFDVRELFLQLDLPVQSGVRLHAQPCDFWDSLRTS